MSQLVRTTVAFRAMPISNALTNMESSCGPKKLRLEITQYWIWMKYEQHYSINKNINVSISPSTLFSQRAFFEEDVGATLHSRGENEGSNKTRSSN